MTRSWLPAVQGLWGLMLVSAVSASGQSVPPAAWSPGATYDVARGRVVVFGGYVRGYVGGTWEWDGRAWSRPTETGPSARNAPALAYDEARHQVVLFGGDRGPEGALGDTWVYDGRQWREIATGGPSPRSIHAMVYDAQRRKVVLFGGVADGHTLRDTWEWDGEAWARMAISGPPPRALHGLAYDAVRARTVLFGGQGVLAPDQPSLADTWEWDGVAWEQIDVSPPGPRDHVGMAFDATTGKVLLHGVAAAGAGAGETWAYDGHGWTRLSDAGPRRGGAKLVFDAGTRRTLLYGGGDGTPTNELWAWSGTAWEPIH
jgi:Galactose oxidase, central domain